MSDLLRVVERSRENPMFAEEFLAREQPSDGPADATAPGRRRRRPVTRRYGRSPAPTGRWKWYDAIRRPVLK